MQFKIKNFKPVPVLRKVALELFENLPKIVLFISCFYFFFHFVYLLIQRFLDFETTVLIKYEAPKNIVFPAFTICGCSARNVLCPESSWKSIGEEMQRRKQSKQSIMEAMNYSSMAENELVTQCFYFKDSREPKEKVACTDIETVVESLHDGRKCLTYLTILHDAQSIGQEDKDGRPHNVTKAWTVDQYTAFIYIKVNFSQFVGKVRERYKVSATLHDSNVIMAIHQTNMLPNMLDSEYTRIEPGFSYEVHFGKQVTRLMPAPFKPSCYEYSRSEKPRSRNECMHLCSMKQSFYRYGCVNHYDIVTRGWLRYLARWNASFDAEKVRYCDNSDGNDAYPAFVQQRRLCQSFCSRDCLEENYSLVEIDSSFLDQGAGGGAGGGGGATGDQQMLDDLLDGDGGGTKSNETVIIIWPDRKMYEMVDHNKEIDLYELIGTLGGLSHLWLHVSAIQLYDIAYMLILKVKILWKKFVYCSLKTY